MRIGTLVTVFVAPLALAACDGRESTADVEDMPMAEDKPMIQSASAEGVVTAVDREASTITIDHGPVPAVDWPAMTMAFKADEELHDKVVAGDEVAFDFEMSEAGSRITSISKK